MFTICSVGRTMFELRLKKMFLILCNYFGTFFANYFHCLLNMFRYGFGFSSQWYINHKVFRNSFYWTYILSIKNKTSDIPVTIIFFWYVYLFLYYIFIFIKIKIIISYIIFFFFYNPPLLFARNVAW